MKSSPVIPSSFVLLLLLLMGSIPSQIHGELQQTTRTTTSVLDSDTIERIDDLCHRIAAADFDYCTSFIDGFVDEMKMGEQRLSHIKQSYHLREGRVRTANGRYLNQKPPQDEDQDAVGFYLFNIGGATFSVLLVALISAMFLGFLTLDPLSLRIKMLAAGECKLLR